MMSVRMIGSKFIGSCGGSRSRFPSGMTARKAKATATTENKSDSNHDYECDS
jgi:hypothetical protein